MKTIYLRNTPKLFINKNFQTIQIKVIFPFLYDEKTLAMMHLLPGMLHNMCNKYPSEQEFTRYSKSIYVLACFCTCSTLGEIGYFTFNYMIPDGKLLKEDYLEEQIAFLSEVIYSPLLEGDVFSSKELDREKDSLIVDIKRVMKDIGSYAIIKAKNIVDTNGRFSSSIYNNLDQINGVDSSNLIEYYKKNILDNNPLIYIFGNTNKERITNLCSKYLYRKRFNKKKYNINIKNYLPLRNKTISYCEDSTFNNSVSILFYKVKDMCEEDELLLSVVRELLSSLSSRLLNKKLRDDFGLVYSSYATTYCNYGILAIVMYIQKENIDLARKKVKDVLLSLKNEEKITPLLNNIKERHKVNLVRQLDDKLALFEDLIIKDLKIDVTSKESYLKLLKVTSHDVANFIDRLVLDTDYFLKEAPHE